MRINQVIRLQDDINFSETSGTFFYIQTCQDANKTSFLYEELITDKIQDYLERVFISKSYSKTSSEIQIYTRNFNILLTLTSTSVRF